MREFINIIEDVSRHLFHVTPVKNLDGIAHHGLVPSRDSQWGVTYPAARVYLMTSRDDVFGLATQMFHTNSDLKELAVLTIDPSQIEGEFHTDPDWDGSSRAVYIEASVPPTAITQVTLLNREDVDYEFTPDDVEW